MPAFHLDLLEINAMTSTDQSVQLNVENNGKLFFFWIKLEVLKLTYLAINASRI